jgi:hypothetical protein
MLSERDAIDAGVNSRQNNPRCAKILRHTSSLAASITPLTGRPLLSITEYLNSKYFTSFNSI